MNLDTDTKNTGTTNADTVESAAAAAATVSTLDPMPLLQGLLAGRQIRTQM